ncbi:MBL fold metallo-hydrolase [Ramlibacter sp.]|uniref:MBL fold metallo-hydrolase n=1 Tax=Ramlibacter sp. TaxID=1917967 RepID=UPI00179B7CB7|nr:MBL fold metallo-hydrolase [Ramlibacter sp.]MBA2674917.1 MBL fold metallo-hydrolase [Ramlibacter sp.]
MKTWYLKSNAVFEPLVCRWYAWPFMVSPATFAMVLKNRLLPILESFVESPEDHAMATEDPSLRGGPFIDFGGDMALPQELLDSLARDCTLQMEFATALEEANKLLLRHDKGSSLEPLYPKLPAALRGLCELGYDLNNAPSLRLIEPLLYASPLYEPRHQSVFLRLLQQDVRPFILSAPLLDESDGLLVEAPFRDGVYDQLARARTSGIADAELQALLAAVPRRERSTVTLADFFTADAPARSYTPSAAGEVRVRYFGHATVLLEHEGVSLLTDPSIGYPMQGGIDRFSYADLPDKLDYVLITHNHQDHAMFETLLQLRHRIGTIVVPRTNGGTLQDPSLKFALVHAGFDSVVELDELESLPIPGGSIVGLPFLGEHGDLHIRSKLGYSVRLGQRSVLCLADSNNLDPRLYERLAPRIGPQDMVFIGMECTGGPMSWLYGALMPARLNMAHDNSRRLSGSDFERARDIVARFDPKAVFVYAMGAEPWFSHITSIVYDDTSAPIVESNKLVAHCRAAGLVSERLYGKRTVSLGESGIAVS